jgi:hypothetical protein
MNILARTFSLHRLDLLDMNPIGLLEHQEELQRLNQQIHFLNGKARGEAKRKKLYFQLVRRVRRQLVVKAPTGPCYGTDKSRNRRYFRIQIQN